MKNWAVFVSGQGTNLANFIKLEKAELKNQKIKAVIADKTCVAIERAKEARKPTLILSPRVAGFESHLLKFLAVKKIDAIFLMGYMRILPAEFLKKWKKPIINIHPSWLPAYPGLNAVKQAFDADADFIGVSLHEVVAEVDAGPILRQMSFARDKKLSFDELLDQVHECERKLVRDFLLDLDAESS